MVTLAIVGSRQITDADIGAIVATTSHRVTAVISGGAIGVDTLAAQWAESAGVDLVAVLPDYQRLGKAAPHIRNREIVDRAGALLAIWDAEPLPANAIAIIDRARRRGIPVDVCKADGSRHPDGWMR